MIRTLLLLTFVVVSLSASAQNHEAMINEQVWKPFTKAIMNQDVAGFVSLHSTDLVRAEVNRKQVMNLEAYRKGMESGWPKWKESIEKNKESYRFELRFLERICNGELAYEIGYFKNEVTNASGVKHETYGKFHVVLRKEAGVWKVLVDADSNEGGTITSEMFLAAKPIGD